jgi:hypothetical protein
MASATLSVTTHQRPWAAGNAGKGGGNTVKGGDTTDSL